MSTVALAPTSMVALALISTVALAPMSMDAPE
jgi:hypothetical protein